MEPGNSVAPFRGLAHEYLGMKCRRQDQLMGLTLTLNGYVTVCRKLLS